MATATTRFSFYFRSISQYDAAQDFVRRILSMGQKTPTAQSAFSFLIKGPSANIKSPTMTIKGLSRKIPKTVPGKKRYLATLTVSNDIIPSLGFDIVEELTKLELEMVDKTHKPPKYSNDDLIRIPTVVKGMPHYRRLIAILNQKYGHGNWHFRNCTNILAKLRRLESISLGLNTAIRNPGRLGVSDSLGNAATEEIRNGVSVSIVVPKSCENSQNLERYIFQASLMS